MDATIAASSSELAFSHSKEYQKTAPQAFPGGQRRLALVHAGFGNSTNHDA